MKCPRCGARLKRDYKFCNKCGHVLSEGKVIKSTPVTGGSRPRIVAEPSPRPKVGMHRSNLLQRKNALYVLLTVMAMAPLSIWVEVEGTGVGILATSSEGYYGQYLTLLSALGMMVVLMDGKIDDGRTKKMAMIGVGAASMAVTALDMAKVWVMDKELYSLLHVQAGIGMYMAMTASVLLVLAVVLPIGVGKARSCSKATYVIRPGSPGSNP